MKNIATRKLFGIKYIKKAVVFLLLTDFRITFARKLTNRHGAIDV